MNGRKIAIIFSLLIIVGIFSAFVLSSNDKTQTNSKEFPERPQPDREIVSDEPIGAISGVFLNEELDEYEELTFPDNVLDTSDWKTYQNKEFGFEVKYPKDWELENMIEQQLRFIFWPISRHRPDDRGTYVFISDKTLEGFVQDAHANPNDFKSVSKFIHNGMAGVIIEVKLGLWNESYPFPDEREIIKQYTFDIGNHRVTFYSPSNDNGFNAVLEQILLSFKLIN